MVFFVSPFAFLEMQFKGRAHAVELSKSSLRGTPECFDAIDVGSALRKARLVFVDAHMPIIADVNQPIIAALIVGIHDALRRNMSNNYRV